MKIVTIIGARPQFVKAAAFSNNFRKIKNNIEILVHTGQHYDQNMSDIFFEELNIPKPDYNLGIGSFSHGIQTGKMLEKIEEILLKEKPDGVLLYGDTNSTLAGALSASKLLIPVFHVEAGLRSYDMTMPEEQNRILTDHISTLLFAPTPTAVKCLKKEGITKGIYNVGDIMYEAVLNNVNIAEKKYSKNKWLRELITENKQVKNLKEKEYYLATIHRPVNTDNENNLKIIFETLNGLDKKVILPIHPRTIKKISSLNLNLDNIIIIEPVGYLLMLYLTKNAHMVITDSGGLQKEAFFLRTPCTTFRDTTEWVETLDNKWNVLCKINQHEILNAIYRKRTFLNKSQAKKFGDGLTSNKIIEIINKTIVGDK